MNSPYFCELAGTTTPFTTAQLEADYLTHTDFVAKWAADVIRLVVQGYIAPVDGAHLIAAAQASTVP